MEFMIVDTDGLTKGLLGERRAKLNLDSEEPFFPGIPSMRFIGFMLAGSNILETDFARESGDLLVVPYFPGNDPEIDAIFENREPPYRERIKVVYSD